MSNKTTDYSEDPFARRPKIGLSGSIYPDESEAFNCFNISDNIKSESVTPSEQEHQNYTHNFVLNPILQKSPVTNVNKPITFAIRKTKSSVKSKVTSTRKPVSNITTRAQARRNQNEMSATSLIPLLPELGPNDNVLHFIDRCEILLNILPQPQEKQMLTSFILVKLQGNAQKAVLGANANTWPAIKIALATLAKSSRLVEDIQAEMSARTQRPNETVKKYGEIMQALLAELNKAYVKELADGENEVSPSVIAIIERQAIRAFESGLRNEQLRMMVILSKGANLAESIACAVTFENRLPQGPVVSHPVDRPVSASNRPVCENCNKTGHTKNNCYQKTGKTEQTVFCNYCKANDHHISVCQIRKTNNLKFKGDENFIPSSRVNHVQVTSQVASSSPSHNQENDAGRVGTEESLARIQDLSLSQ